MPDRHHILTPEALSMVDAIARTGSFAAAARELGKVPSALTYNVRQLEEALDVLLFDRSSRQAQFTAAGQELLAEGRRLLAQMDAVAQRVRRVATGWETQLTLAVDGVMSQLTMFELCEAFFAIDPDEGARAAPPGRKKAADAPARQAGDPPARGPGTRLRLRTEVLAGTWEALVTGQADLAIGVATSMQASPPAGVHVEPLGTMEFVFAVAPHHPLAALQEPLGDDEILRHRAVAVADSAQRFSPITVNLLPGQEVLTVSSTPAKVEAHLRCMGCGFLPEPVVRHHIEAGRLVVKPVQRPRQTVQFGYAWRAVPSARQAAGGEASPLKAPLGLGLQWWLKQLQSPATRKALLERHSSQWIG